MTVYKKEEKMAFTIDLNDVQNKCISVFLISAAMAVMFVLGYCVNMGGLDTLYSIVVGVLATLLVASVLIWGLMICLKNI